MMTATRMQQRPPAGWVHVMGGSAHQQAPHAWDSPVARDGVGGLQLALYWCLLLPACFLGVATGFPVNPDRESDEHQCTRQPAARDVPVTCRWLTIARPLLASLLARS
jgi:hypothetical protein